ncbi:MAG: sugar phosphate isomerase/epimerase family protein [Terriglobales bacterium]
MHRRDFLRTSLGAGLGAAWVGSAGALALPAGGFDYPWKLGLITDEASPDLARVLAHFVPRYHLHWVELRDLRFGRRIVYFGERGTPAEVRQVQRQLRAAGVRLSVLDTGIYKVWLPGTSGPENRADLNPSYDSMAQQLEILKHACGVARELGTRKVRIFTFRRVRHPERVFDRVVEHLHRALEVARREDVELLVENEYDCNMATGGETARLLRAIPDPRLKHNWDPGNCFASGEEPYPRAWNQLDHSRIAHMHLKDAARDRAGHYRWLPVGGGRIDYLGQFRALKAMGYQGTMSLETHYRNAQNDPWTSSIESMNGIQRLLRSI